MPKDPQISTIPLSVRSGGKCVMTHVPREGYTLSTTRGPALYPNISARGSQRRVRRTSFQDTPEGALWGLKIL